MHRRSRPINVMYTQEEQMNGWIVPTAVAKVVRVRILAS